MKNVEDYGYRTGLVGMAGALAKSTASRLFGGKGGGGGGGGVATAAPADEPEPPQNPQIAGGSTPLGSVGSLAGAALGTVLGGPAGGFAGSAIGSFVGDTITALHDAPRGPGATIEGGSVGSGKSAGDAALSVGHSLQQLAQRGLQNRASPNGKGKVF